MGFRDHKTGKASVASDPASGVSHSSGLCSEILLAGSFERDKRVSRHCYGNLLGQQDRGKPSTHQDCSYGGQRALARHVTLHNGAWILDVDI